MKEAKQRDKDWENRSKDWILTLTMLYPLLHAVEITTIGTDPRMDVGELYSSLRILWVGIGKLLQAMIH
jgi:hypothetical protein